MCVLLTIVIECMALANWFKGVHQALKTHIQQTMLRPCYCSPENNRGVGEAVRLWTAFMVALLTLVGYMTVIRENISGDMAVSRGLRKLLDDQDSNAPDTDLIEFF